MNTFNRVVALILLICAIFVCSAVLLLPAFKVPLLDSVATQLSAVSDFIDRLNWYVRIPLAILFAVTVDIIIVFMIVAEFSWPRPRFIRVEKASGGEVKVSVASIADRVQYEVDQLPTILRSRPKVSAKGGGVLIELDVETAAGIDVPIKADQILDTIQTIVGEKLGLKMARPPKINLHTVAYPKSPVMVKPERLPALPDQDQGVEL